MNKFLAAACSIAALASAALSAPAFAVSCSTAPLTVVSYFKPTAAQLPNFVNQGGYHASLCNDARTPHTAATTCTSIDLKGYLYAPSNPSAPVSGRPLIVWVDGSATNDDHPDQPPTGDYLPSCEQATYFTSKGYQFLAIVRRGYPPSTGENEIVREAKSGASTAIKFADQVNYMANEAFEVQKAINYMLKLKGSDNNPLINVNKIGVIGHSFGGIVTLYFGTSGNKQPIIDAGNATGLTQARVKAMIAPASQSWDGYDSLDGTLNDTSTIIEGLKTAAQHSLLPEYFLEPINDASYRPAAVLGKAAADYQLDVNRQCRNNVYANASLTPDEKARKIADQCARPVEVQTSLFAPIAITDPTDSSAHGQFNRTPSLWGPSVAEYFARHGVK